jgi:hypothetical protein
MDLQINTHHIVIIANIINGFGALCSFYATYLLGRDSEKRKIFMYAGFSSGFLIVGGALLESYPALTLDIIWLGISIIGFMKIALPKQIIHLKYLLPPIILCGLVCLALGNWTLAAFSTTGLYVIAYLIFSAHQSSKLWYLSYCLMGYVLFFPHLLDAKSYSVFVMETVSFLIGAVGVYQLTKVNKANEARVEEETIAPGH